MNTLLHALIFLGSLALIWSGAGVIVNAVEKLALKAKSSQFIISFFILGIMTSIPEISIGLNALKEGEPEIFSGNLLGGSVVIFLLIIPIFGILGNGVKLNHELGDRNLILFLSYIFLPVLFLIDGKAGYIEGGILVLFYLSMLFLTYRKRHIEEGSNFDKKHILKSIKEFVFIILGLILVLFASNLLVVETEYFATRFQVSELVLSLLILSLGTNIPELSLAIRSVAKGKKDIAFGNYLGSAVANSLVLGLLILLSGGIVISTQLGGVLVAMFIGIGLFYFFARSKDELSRKESLLILICYFLFVLYEAVFKF